MQNIKDIIGQPKRKVLRVEKCEKHNLEFNIELVSFNTSDFEVGYCPMCKEDDEKREKEENDRKTRERLEKRHREKMLENGMGEKYLTATIDNYENKERIPHVIDFYNNPRNRILIMLGDNGTGKTHLGCAICSKYLGLYYTMYRLLLNTYSIDNRAIIVDKCIKTPMLVLDEIGKTANTDYTKDLFCGIIDERYFSNKPTVLISNLYERQLHELFGNSLSDRLREVGVKEVMRWESFRKGVKR